MSTSDTDKIFLFDFRFGRSDDNARMTSERGVAGCPRREGRAQPCALEGRDFSLPKTALKADIFRPAPYCRSYCVSLIQFTHSPNFRFYRFDKFGRIEHGNGAPEAHNPMKRFRQLIRFKRKIYAAVLIVPKTLRRMPAALQNIRVYLFVEQKLYFYRSAGSIPNAEFAVEMFFRIKIFRAVKTLRRCFRIFHSGKCEYSARFVF